MSRENTQLSTEINAVQKQITSGKRLVKMSDEPWTVSQVHQLREESSLQSVFKDSSNQAKTLLTQTENALQSSLTILTRLRELAIKGANDTYSLDDLTSIAGETENLKETILNLSNSDFNGRYLFAGKAYDSEPFDATFTYVGSTDEVSIDVSKTGKVEVGFDGSDVFQGSVDVFTAIDDFLTGLANDDDTLIQAAIDDFDSVFNHMSDYLTRLGGEMNLAMDMEEVATSVELSLKERLMAVEEVDIALALTRFSMLQTQYEVNLQLTSKTRGMSLFARM
jgi:flagellar hook-associated protein 3 FlgL